MASGSVPGSQMQIPSKHASYIPHSEVDLQARFNVGTEKNIESQGFRLLTAPHEYLLDSQNIIFPGITAYSGATPPLFL